MNDEQLLEKIKLLQSKYAITGQDLNSYLEGLYETDYLNYWDYIHLDTLLSLQIPRTTLPDEEIFIMYHQVTELYFKLILLELKQIAHAEKAEAPVLEMRLKRVNRYFEALIQSFTVMMDGMEPKQFMKFRMALLPASGFQSVQYRLIELACTSATQLMEKESKPEGPRLDLAGKLEKIYWRKGATELKSGRKTLTLERFEQKYNRLILDFATEYEHINLMDKLKHLDWSLPELQGLRTALRLLDQYANVDWPLAHFHSAMRYLNRPPEVIQATGGTNWQRYLPPRFQKTVFFPFLWSDEEIDDWGKTAVQKAMVQPF